MKLSTLLLSSAALVVAGSAYAADLPAKKGAPAAKAATGCPAFGAGFFQIPGGDTCIKFQGHMRYKGSYSNDSTDVETAPYSQTARFRLETDVRNNSDIGVVRGFARINSTTSSTDLGKAYVQVGGLTAGLNANLADIAGTNADTYGSNLGGGSAMGIQYDAAMGESKFSLQVVNASNNTVSGVADRPDILVGFSTKAGPADVKVVAVSSEAMDTGGTSVQGYALVGRVGMALGGGFGVAAFGGSSLAASSYTTSANLVDYDGTDKATGTNFGGEVTFATGSGTLAIAADQSKETLGSDTNQVNNIGISYAATLAKGLSIEPEFITSTEDDSTSGKSTSNTLYLRIQRDF